MNLHFDWTDVQKAISEARRSRKPRTLYGETTGPGLWLVGDQGIYLLPNTSAKNRTVVYARECNPKTLPFDTWWDVKQQTFGGDDGIDFIDLHIIEELAASANTKVPRLLALRLRPACIEFDVI